MSVAAKILLFLLTIFVGAVGRADAQSGPELTVTGGGFFIDSENDFLWLTPRFGNGGQAVRLWRGGTLALSEPGMITLEYIGKEANYADNAFLWGGLSAGEPVFSTGGSSPNLVGQTAASPVPPVTLATSTVPGIVPAGALPFSFFVNQTGSNKPNGSSDIAYWPLPVGAGLAGETKRFGTVVYALLDDGKTDNDYDDMIVRLTVIEVPEPTTLALATAGMVPAAGWALRRMKK